MIYMAEDDIYGNKSKYEKLVEGLDKLSTPLDKANDNHKSKYYCRNKVNLEYFRRLFRVFDSRDTSYVRRNRLLNTFKLIVHCTDKDLKGLTRDDIGDIIAFMHKNYDSPKSKSDFIRDLKYLWKTLFPEIDDRGRVDETVIPYVVRHLSAKIDKSREKRRDDRLTYEEIEKIVAYFSSDPRMQLFLMLSVESLSRPQELLYTRLKDIDMHDNYAKINISEHGKEGIGFLQCIDSFPYLQEWLRKHPTQKDKNSFLFINIGRKGFGSQMSPFNLNRMLRLACKDLGINKPITAYSLKRNGVTLRRLRGDSDVEIQHIARWTSTKQLKIYDKSDQEDALRLSLVKKGMLQDDRYKQYEPKTKTCIFCGAVNGFTSESCSNCKRPLDRRKVEEEFRNYEQMKKDMAAMEQRLKQESQQPLEMQRFASVLARLESEIAQLKAQAKS